MKNFFEPVVPQYDDELVNVDDFFLVDDEPELTDIDDFLNGDYEEELEIIEIIFENEK